VISDEGVGFDRRLIGGMVVDLLLSNPDALRRGYTGALTIALKDLKVVRDPKWLITPFSAEFQDRSDSYMRLFAENSIFQALSKIGRFNDSSEAGLSLDAAFWLQSSAYSFASAIIAYENRVPRVSHILQELRVSKYALHSGVFKVLADTLDLNLATDISVARRLEVLRELLNVASKIRYSYLSPSTLSRHSYRLAEDRCIYLVRSHALLDAYCYLGYKATMIVEDLYEADCKALGVTPEYYDILQSLIRRLGEKGLSGQTLRLMGLNSDAHFLEKQGSCLKDVVKKIAKTISKG